LYERFLDVLASREAGRIDELMRIVEARPTFVAAQLTAASMLIENGRAGEAVALLETSGRAAEAPLPLRERFGAALLGAGRLEHAEQVLTDIVQDPQASADAWNALGVVRATRGRPSEAVVAFDRAVVLAPGAARFQFNRALAHRDAGDMARSRDDLVALTGRHPAFADGWRALADMRYRAGDRTGAIEAWRKVVTLVSTDSDAWSNLAVALRELGRFDEAREIEDRRP
jgi:Flp pilus assembly protein TadD